MPINIDLDQSLSSKMLKTYAPGVFPTGQGPNIYFNGPFCSIATAMPAYASSSTETSLITGATTTGFGTAPTMVNIGSQSGNATYISGTYRIPGNFLLLGTRVAWDFIGSIANTVTPNLTVKAGLQNASTGTFTALATTGVTAMVNLAGTGVIHVKGYFMITASASATSNTIVGWIGNEYGYGTAVGNDVYGGPTSTATFDLSVDYFFDVRATWGTNSASNTITLSYGNVWVLA